MMIKHSIAAAVLALALGAGTAQAQARIPFTVEGRVDRVAPLGDFDKRAGVGFNLGASAAVQLRAGLAAYASYSYAEFSPSLLSTATDARDEGVSLGLTAAIPTGTTRLQPYVAGGLVLHQMTLRDDLETDEDAGFEVGAGVVVPVVGRLRLTPAVSYRSYDVKPQLSGTGGDAFTVQYLSAGVGLNLAF